jgi:hypothetical protein
MILWILFWALTMLTAFGLGMEKGRADLMREVEREARQAINELILSHKRLETN